MTWITRQPRNNPLIRRGPAPLPPQSPPPIPEPRPKMEIPVIQITAAHIDSLFAGAIAGAKGDLEQMAVLAGVKLAAKIALPAINVAYAAHSTVSAAAPGTVIWSTLASVLGTVLTGLLPSGGILSAALPILLEVLSLALPTA